MISSSQYISILEAIDSNYENTNSLLNELSLFKANMAKTRGINNISSLNENIDHLRYYISQDDMALQNATYSLQSYVKYLYGDVNVFLQNNNIKVSQYFAGISLSAGFRIDQNNISA